MKKTILLSVICLLCASMVFALGKKDLAGLNGTWEGTGTGVGGGSAVVKLEILNDTEPLQGKLTISNIPDKAKTEYGVSDPVVGESNDGQITSAGTIMFTGPNGMFEITSVKDKKLSGWGYFKGLKVNLSVTKK